MFFSSKSVVAAVATTLLALAASPSFADTVVKVIESGEDGGAMAIKLDTTSVKAGLVTFAVHNEAASEEHEMVLVKLKSADEKIPLNKNKDRVEEKKLKSLGEVEDLNPGANGELKADLKPGSYLLLCNIKGHYSAGMHARLTVNP
ncbi:plastocyanin/azurin family copper-binding protein [Rhizobium sp. NXC24]|uniref:plastocyanin/azurin family copper-binding protein n=1 Tax=Rhizobium sp. NXC24 TaxID=2048897 RepID=UPI000CDF4738|nr:plastocyanin/azurin family copper-binding protein [Rhizobium sp. NXC24]AVA25346.1 cupredoxin family protein [Rhizobium sp. NXC24]